MATKKAELPEKKVTGKLPASKMAEKITSPEKRGKTDLEAEVFDMAGKIVGAMKLPGEIFGAKINSVLMAQAVRVYLANQRKGSASTKTRGEVTGSTRKIYRQKGTGRARHGGIRAPIFVHGGIAHGPRTADHSRNLPKNMKRAALFSALSAKVKDNEVKILQGIESVEMKTKTVAHALGKMDTTKNVLIVMPKHMENVFKAARNIKGVDLTSADRLNTYEVLEHKSVILMKDTVSAIEHIFRKEKKHGSE